MNIIRSQELFKEAQTLMPGGVNSPVRAFRSVGLDPLYIARANGSRVWDVDGNEFIDYVGSWGPMILGHSNPRVIDAIKSTAENGTSFGACCEQELELARLIKKFVPSIEKVRMVNSGTEATMSAMRLARAFTGRDKIMKFAGHFHGWHDELVHGFQTPFDADGSLGIAPSVRTNTVALPGFAKRRTATWSPIVRQVPQIPTRTLRAATANAWIYGPTRSTVAVAETTPAFR